jgi:hypothetical protein
MARNPTRVARGERGVDDHGDPQLGFDEALVGGADDQAATITIDPSEAALNPFLGGEDDDDWDLPDDKKKKTDAEPPPRRQRETRQEDEPEDAEEDIRFAYDEEAGEERGGRRSRRNRSVKRQIGQRDETIAELQARLAKTEEQLSGLMGGQFNLSARDVEQRIQYHQNAIDRADVEIAKAIKESDGDTAVALQRERDKIMQGLYQLNNTRQQMAEHAKRMAEGGEVDADGQPQRRIPPEVRQQIAAQDQQYERMRDVFLERYTWFDPDEGDDPDHDFVKRIDRKLVTEGYSRHQPAFWHEMERRMNKAGFRPDGRTLDEEEDVDERPRREFRSRRETNGDDRRRGGDRDGNGFQRRANLPPTGRVHSNTRPGRGETAFRMSDEQIDLLRQEGLLENNLDEKEQAKKDRIIGKWERGARALAASRR